LRKDRGGVEMLEPMYSVIQVVFILVACVELCGMVADVDVYHVIQYDLVGDEEDPYLIDEDRARFSSEMGKM
ncbi:hypothetical protein U1Q18_043395, partial [Sarracenia purpurea var. burkii]